MLNKDTQIRVKTSFGITDVAPTGENVAQGSIGGGLISALNLCKTMTAYFTGSDSEMKDFIETNKILTINGIQVKMKQEKKISR